MPQEVSAVEAARVALRFLNRAQIVGEEVDAFGIARQLLQAIVSGDLILTPKPAPEGAEPPSSS